ERGVGERQVERVALEHRAEPAELRAAEAQRAGRFAQRGAVEIEPDHVRAALDRAEAVAALAAARVEQTLSAANPKPPHLEGAHPAASPRPRRRPPRRRPPSETAAGPARARRAPPPRRGPVRRARRGSPPPTPPGRAAARAGPRCRPCRPPRAARPRRSRS